MTVLFSPLQTVFEKEFIIQAPKIVDIISNLAHKFQTPQKTQNIKKRSNVKVTTIRPRAQIRRPLQLTKNYDSNKQLRSSHATSS